MASSELGGDHASSIRYPPLAIRPWFIVLATLARPSLGNGTGKKFRGAGSRQAFKRWWYRLSARSCSSAMRWVWFHSTHPTKKEKKK
jgi:hypothetical protein